MPKSAMDNLNPEINVTGEGYTTKIIREYPDGSKLVSSTEISADKCGHEPKPTHCNHGHWVFCRHRTCCICGEPAEYEAVEFGYGSEFDEQIICPECCEKWIDPAVKAAKGKRNA